MTHADSPIAAQTPPAMAERVMHARLALGPRLLMASDSMVGQPYAGMQGFSISLIYREAAEARRIFEGCAAGGKVTMAIQKTFWSEAFGMVTDRFGTPWMVNGGMATS